MVTTIGQALHDTRDTLASDYTAGGTSLVLSSGQGAKYAGATATAPFYVRVDDELFTVTARSTDTLTVVGARGGTSAANHTTNTQVVPLLTHVDWTAARGLLLALETRVIEPTFDSVASGATLTLDPIRDLVTITGTTTITAINTSGHTGHRVTLVFASEGCKVTRSSTLMPSSDPFISVANGSLTLVCDGTNWIELARANDTGWVTPSLVNSWVGAATALTDGPTTFEYRKLSNSLVRFRGALTTGTVATVACTLPVGCRPPHQVVTSGVNVSNGGGAGKINIESDGDVIPNVNTTAQDYMSVSFLAEQ